MARRKLRHKTNKRLVREPVIILGDGETEESYFKHLHSLNIFPKLHIKFEQGDENNFEIKLKEHADNDHILLILDIDNTSSTDPRYSAIDRLASKKSYKKQVYFNNYSFETWLINHINYFATPIDRPQSYDGHILNAFGVRSWYNNKNNRNRTTIMNAINTTNLLTAEQNIARMNQKEAFNNPSSNMDELIDYLRKI